MFALIDRSFLNNFSHYKILETCFKYVSYSCGLKIEDILSHVNHIKWPPLYVTVDKRHLPTRTVSITAYKAEVASFIRKNIETQKKMHVSIHKSDFKKYTDYQTSFRLVDQKMTLLAIHIWNQKDNTALHNTN